MKKINVLSLFDGMSCGQLALQRAGINISKYYASEIDKHAISVTMNNFPDTVQLGNISNIESVNLPKIDLLIGGSPCTNFSVAGNQNGMSTKENVQVTSLEEYLELKAKNTVFVGQSYLFWEYIRLLREIKPKYFLLENVKMQKKYKDAITKELGVEPIEINSNSLSAQHRRRLYWTNIPVDEIESKGLLLSDIVEHGIGGIPVVYDSSGTCNMTARNQKGIRLTNNIKVPHTVYEARTEAGKKARRDLRKKLGRDTTPRGPKYKEYLSLKTLQSNCLVATSSELDYIVDFEYNYRKLTITECERLQTLPDGYTNIASESQRRKMIGNGWTVDVIAHIFKNLGESDDTKT